MSQVHLVLLWHMHQPQYRDPKSRKYVLPWTRLHALKDYWGMVRILTEFPGIHSTFNIVPSLARQIEEYASGKFDEPWNSVALKVADQLTPEDKQEILLRAYQLNHEHLMSRWPRFVELFNWRRNQGAERAATQFGLRDWRDLQLLSQLAWMDEEYLARDPIVSALSQKGANFTEDDKRKLHLKQKELLSRVLPEYREAAARGQIEISTTPFYHPILPLLCDSQIARVANPHSPALVPPFRFPEDAREQLTRARGHHERLFGATPDGLWPSEGSVSDEALGIASGMGFRWFATDEGVLGRTKNIAFWRDNSGFPENAAALYTPWKFRFGGKEICGIFRDHYLSDLIGFVYSKMSAQAAAEDFYRRLRAIGDRVPGNKPATVSVILDGENAWEYYPGNGREFLRQVYARIQKDPNIKALTVSEAIAAAEEMPALEGIFPGSWINANFDIWIGDGEDIRAWELLREARLAYSKAQANSQGKSTSASGVNLPRAYESLLAAEGSDWCWWYGPEHSSSNDTEFDELYRHHLAEIYAALGEEAPEALAHSVKQVLIRARATPPTSWLEVQVEGRVTSYFEWLGAGAYATVRRGGAMHGQAYFLSEIYYGFSHERFFVRVDPLPSLMQRLHEFEIHFLIQAKDELKIRAKVHAGKYEGCTAELNGTAMALDPKQITIGVGKIFEISLARDAIPHPFGNFFRLSVSLWRGGLPVDMLPPEGFIEVTLGEENFAWRPDRS